MATLQWYNWNGTLINNLETPSTVTFTVGALNTTLIFTANTKDSTVDLNSSILYLNVSARGSLPNTDGTRTFKHENFFHANSLAQAELVDPGIELSYSNDTKKFTVEATTGFAVWTWLDYPAGPLLNFDANGFILRPGEPKEIGYTLKSDPTGGDWVEEVTVQSLWNNTLPY